MYNKYYCKELDYARQIVKDGFITNNIKYELTILAKYFKSLGLSKAEAKSRIIDICNRSIKEFYYEVYYPIIEGSINTGFKKELVQIDEISFYKEELNYVNSINVNYSVKKLMFGLLLIKKINQAVANSENIGFVFNGSKYNYSNLKKFSGLSNRTQRQINYMFAELIDVELVSVRDDDRKYLLFMNHIQGSMELAFTVSNFEAAILLFDNYNGKCKVNTCGVCGEIFKVSSKTNVPLSCKACQRVKDLDKKRKYWRNKNEKTRPD